MRKFFSVCFYSIKMKVRSWKLFFKNLFHYYLRYPKFFLADALVLLQYFWQSPYHMVRKYDEEHDDEVGPYGETDFHTFERILDSFEIPKNVRILDLGSGRGRLCFYLALVRGQKQALGVERISMMVERANRVKEWLRIENCAFFEGDWTLALQETDVLYLYGSQLSEVEIRQLGTFLGSSLKKGTRVITVSWWFGEECPNLFSLEKTIHETFLWGKGKVFLQKIM